jgi:hypothetical protein
MAVFALAMLASVMPPAMCCALVCAIAVTGVTWTPRVLAPAVTLGMAAVITSPCAIDIGAPVASSV